MGMEELRKYIEVQAKGTLGYKEAENKESFMVGVGVAISIMSVKYESSVKNLELNRDGWKNLCEESQKDLKELSRIIIKYSEIDN